MDAEELANIDPAEYNVLFVTLDSCRYDTTQKANIPFLKSLGEIRKALSHSDYTLPSHIAMFEGRLPTVEDQPYLPLYTNAIRQLWRVSPTGFFETKPKSQIGQVLEGNNIIEGYSKLGYFTIGVASLNHFTKGRVLNNYFETFFDYYDIKEGLIDPRPLKGFPLAHINNIVNEIKKYKKWFLFINAKETHYPYDTGEGYPDELLPLMQKMQRHLNLRHDGEEFTTEESEKLHSLQVSALEKVDQRLKELVEKLPKDRPILVVICSDHGDSFGEISYGLSRCGHLHPSKEVLEVPLLIGKITN